MYLILFICNSFCQKTPVRLHTGVNCFVRSYSTITNLSIISSMILLYQIFFKNYHLRAEKQGFFVTESVTEHFTEQLYHKKDLFDQIKTALIFVAG